MEHHPYPLPPYTMGLIMHTFSYPTSFPHGDILGTSLYLLTYAEIFLLSTRE